MNQLIQTWEIHNRINLYLLNAIQAEYLPNQAASKGRGVGKQFIHIHHVRLIWLKQAYPDFLASLIKLDKNEMNKQILGEQLIKSGEAIKTLLEKRFDEDKIKGFKSHLTAFLGYLIAHEAHHRGQIILSLKQSGQPVDKKILFGL